jgi:bifunctional non-homologous end joining protein LigD
MMPEKPAPDLDALLRYRRKRDFNKTPEPQSGAPETTADLAFVVQQHRATRMHWDFRLEVDGVLWSWAVTKGPSLNPKDKRLAVHVEDHPFDYGGFEGVIPKGNYGAGQVIVWDNGTYTPDEDGELNWGDRARGQARMREGLAAGKLSFTMRGSKLRGSFTLVRIKKSEGDDWLLIKHRDEYASERDVLEDDRSVISGLTINDLREGRMPVQPEGAGASGLPAGAKAAAFPQAQAWRPMLPTLVGRPFGRAGWLFEPKFDGVRTLAFVHGGKADLRTRRGNPASAQYPEIADALERQPLRSAVFDGEIIAMNAEGVPDFQEIQSRINLSNPREIARVAAEIPVFYYVFDLMYHDGYDLRAVALSDRKALLWRVLEQGLHIRYVDHVMDDGLMMHEASRNLGLEGMVGKRANSVYEIDTRARTWLKVKDVNQQEFVIGGYTEGEGSRSKTFGGILVGYYDGDELRFAASVGSGFSDAMLDRTLSLLEPLRSDVPPFVNPPTMIGGRWSGGKAARCFWVRPELVAEVKFASWTREGNLRAPVFLGLRQDIDPKTIGRETAASSVVDVIADEPTPAAPSDAVAATVASVLEQLENPKDEFIVDVGGASIKLTNLSKEFWPSTSRQPARTKRELIRYYARIAPWILPHLRDRPLTLTRYPNGIHGKSFYQKHWASEFPAEFPVDRVRLWSSHGGEDQEYILVDNVQTLVWLAQLADLEMHTSMARVSQEPDARDLPLTFAGSEENLEASVLNYPDYMVIDLDPYIYAGTEKKGEEPVFNRRGFEKAREVAFALKDMLQQLRLSAFVKTTGKTGLHIYVPIVRHFTYDEIRAAAATVGQFIMQQMPNDITMEWTTSKRTGKVFFDHNQNTRGKTLAAQYSLRPSPNAGVSAPVTWEELPQIMPTDFDIDTVPVRLAEKGDLWAHILDAKQDLRALIAG